MEDLESHDSLSVQNKICPIELSDETEVGGMMWSDLKGLAMMPDYQQHGWYVSKTLSDLTSFSLGKTYN